MENQEEEELDFEWIETRGRGKTHQFYGSFMYDGTHYSLYDCVYLYKDGEPQPYIGKIVKMWETRGKLKKVKVHWFFRPSDINFYLKDKKVVENELFFATGAGIGLVNVNPLEAIAGKCNVICTSNDGRNPQPSSDELQKADYIFYRTFNVENFIISENFQDIEGELEVKFIFNRKTEISSNPNPSHGLVDDRDAVVQDNHELPIQRQTQELKSTPTLKSGSCVDLLAKGCTPPIRSENLDTRPTKRVKFGSQVDSKSKDLGQLNLEENLKSGLKGKANEKMTKGEKIVVARRPNSNNTWFKDLEGLLPWEDRMRTAHEEGTLIFLQNLDPEYTSAEVEDIIWYAFKEKCSAKMVPHTAISSPVCGQAFVILKSKDAADKIKKRLHEGCLMLPHGRPLVVGVARIPKVSEKQLGFVGHLSIDKIKHKIQKEMKEAVSTSHYSQPNTIEYGMAMDWFLQQKWSEMWWAKLYEQQADEVREVTANLKRKRRLTDEDAEE